MSAGPRVRCGHHRCPHCGRQALAALRLARQEEAGALDLDGPACRAGAEVMRVRCPEHGVVAEAVPWARHHTMFCCASGDQVARLAPNVINLSWLSSKLSRYHQSPSLVPPISKGRYRE